MSDKVKFLLFCAYCEYYELYDIEENEIDFYGYCKLKNITKSGLEQICDKFIIKSCIHTQKDYSGKNKK